MNRLIQIFFILMMIYVPISADKMWKITTSYGDNLSCTDLVKISNDSLHTIILNRNRVFAINDIERISTFNSNINKMMLFGSLIGGTTGLVIDSALGNKKLDVANNGFIYTITGLVSGTMAGHFISSKNTIDLSMMSLPDKRNVIVSMIIGK